MLFDGGNNDWCWQILNGTSRNPFEALFSSLCHTIVAPLSLSSFLSSLSFGLHFPVPGTQDKMQET